MGGSLDELEAAWMAATAYAATTDAVAFDHQEAKVFTPPEAREIVGMIARDRPRCDAVMAEMARTFAPKS